MSVQYRHGERHVYRHIAGEHLLIALHRDTVAPMFAFTPTAAALWHRLEAWASPAALVAHLCERFDVEPEQAAGDVAAFLEQLAQIGAVDVREEAE